VAPANLQWTAVCPPNTTSSANVATTTTCTGSGNKQTCTTKTTTSTSKSIAKSTPSSGFSANNQIQADRVQATGNKGKGIKIGIVDTGVDYTRTPLGGCFGSGCKIAGGYDFVGDNYDGTNNPVPDNDPFDGCNGHGTTMAGIIGANDNEYGVPGVASEASLYMYRVFSCSGATTDDIVIQGALRAYTDNMDVINLSLGESPLLSESPAKMFRGDFWLDRISTERCHQSTCRQRLSCR
jgi:subtilisin family serine protease